MTIGLVFQWSAVFEKKRLHHFLIIASKTTCYVAEGRELHPNVSGGLVLLVVIFSRRLNGWQGRVREGSSGLK